MPIINSKRIHDYPRLMFITIWTILALNVIFSHGWLGATKQIIGSDFITLYGSGLAYRTDITHLYDLQSQTAIQQALIRPTELPGVNPYISPPYVAALFSLFTFIKLPWAFGLWTLMTFSITLLAVRNLVMLNPEIATTKHDFWQFLIIVLAFFPFVEGFQVGQNHALTLLFVTLVLVFSISERWFMAGAMAGLMLYKPQMVIGLIVVLIIWRKYKALGGIAALTLIWVGGVIISHGLTPFINYLGLSRELLLLPYTQGFPGYLLLTFYGLLTTLLPIKTLPAINLANLIISGMMFLGLIWLSFKSRNLTMIERTPVLVLAFLLPIVATPYALLHDLVILIPGFVLWWRYNNSRPLLLCAIGVYLAAFFLPLIGSLANVALMPFVTIGLTAVIFLFTFTQKKDIYWKFHQ